MENAADKPSSLEECWERIAQQNETIQTLNDSVAKERAELEKLRKLLVQLLKGNRSERHIPTDPQQQFLSFGDEAELEAARKEAELIVQQYTVNRQVRKRKRRDESLPADLPRVERVMEVPRDQQYCDEHGERKVIGYDRTESLIIEPAKLLVEVRLFPKFACEDNPQCGIVSPERPTSLVEGDKYRPSVAASIVMGGKSRTDSDGNIPKALDHDPPAKEKLVPLGILTLATGALTLCFGHHETSDFWADCLRYWWIQVRSCHRGVRRLVIYLDNGPKNSGSRTQFLKRLTEFADWSGLEVRLVYYPPYHSKYNPIERCWSSLQKKWNGTLLTCWSVVKSCAERMTWKGNHPEVSLIEGHYPNGITVAKAEMKLINTRLVSTLQSNGECFYRSNAEETQDRLVSRGQSAHPARWNRYSSRTCVHHRAVVFSSLPAHDGQPVDPTPSFQRLLSVATTPLLRRPWKRHPIPSRELRLLPTVSVVAHPFLAQACRTCAESV